MVADNSEEPASTKETATTAKIGNGNEAASQPQVLRVSHSKKKFSMLLLALVIVIGALVAFGRHTNEKPYAEAAGHKIYKKDVEDLVKNSKGISKRDAAVVLADKYLTETLAKEQGITITDKDIEAAYGPGVIQAKSKYKYSYQLQVNELYFNKLRIQSQGTYKGDLLVAHFSRNIELQSRQTPTNPTLVAADKKYAQDFITNLSNQVKAGKITWEQAAELERKDPQIGMNMYGSLSHSGPFDTSKAPVSLFTPASAKQQLQKIKPGQTSKPFVVTVNNTVGPDRNQTFESYFLVVKLDKGSKSGSDMNFPRQLEQTKQKIGYKIHV